MFYLSPPTVPFQSEVQSIFLLLPICSYVTYLHVLHIQLYEHKITCLKNKAAFLQIISKNDKQGHFMQTMI